ncbi:hypothetical protein KR222_008302, partial [Zaprionus bogoriensis]
PKIISKDGNLVFESGANRNITFRLSGNSRLIINGEYDIMDLLLPIGGSKKRPGGKGDFTGTDTVLDLHELTEQLAEFKAQTLGAGGLNSVLRQMQNGTRSNRLQLRRMQRYLRQFETSLQRVKSRLEQDSCRSNPCENGGTCLKLFDGFRCQCRSAFEGTKCERDVNECTLFEGTDLGCQNGGQCFNLFGSFMCACTPGWHGMHCTQRKADCSSASAWELCGHGSCVPSSDALGYRCICEQGWRSNGLTPICSEDVDECSASAHTPCSTECINLPGSFTCGPCAPGLTGNGVNCRDINECETNNGGCSLSPRVACINTYGSSHCGDCPVGWTGDGRTCERSQLPAGSSPNAVGLTSCMQRGAICHPQAICSEISNTITCSCPAGMVGSGYGDQGCIRGTNHNCNDMPCRNGGICLDNGPNNYTCHCMNGFGGRQCDPLPNPCLSQPCKNDGRCRPTPTENGNSFVCQCKPGYRGRLCDVRFSSCNAMLYGLTGRLRYPPGNGSYEHNAQCAWVIRTNESLVLNVTFHSFQLENSLDCRFDWLQINDGRSAAAQIIGRYCGTRLPHGGSLISSSNQLYLWFRSDNSSAHEGFDLTWQSMQPQCGGRFEFETHGTIASPGSPGNYPRNRDCSWHLVAPNDKRIKLTFFSLQLEHHDSCNFDFVSITDVISGQELYKFCSSEQPAPLLLPTHEAIVRFHSDETDSDLGFQLHYAVEERLSGCGGVYSSGTGTIQSPLLPADRLQSVSCDYEIHLAMGEIIKLEFVRFELGVDDCIEVYDMIAASEDRPASSVLQSKNCGVGNAAGNGTALPPSINSLGNRMRVRYFASAASAGGNRFELSYRMDCSRSYDAPNGTVSGESAGFPTKVIMNRLCSYKITTAPGTTIQLVLEDFQLGKSTAGDDDDDDDDDEGRVMFGNSSCVWNSASLTINDGLNRVLLGPYCGDKRPLNLYVSQSNMLVLHLSTGTVGTWGSGFRFTYNTVPARSDRCGGVHTKEGDNIRVPRGPQGHYGNDMNCEWSILAPPNKGIQLHWLSFDVEAGHDCLYDYVDIFDELPEGQSAGGGRLPYRRSERMPLKRLCGNSVPEDMLSMSRMLTIRFVSDFADSGEGFELSYQFVERNRCGGSIFTSTGMLHSPNFPLPYAGGLDCVYQLNAPEGEQLELQVEFFQLRASPNCTDDWLEVRNGGSAQSPLLGRFCGEQMPRRLPSFSHQFHLHFHTQQQASASSARGFRVTWRVYSSGCGGRISDQAGVITSPNYPMPYPKNARCEWLLRVHAGSNVRIELQDIEIESLSDCSYDRVSLEAIYRNGFARRGSILNWSSRTASYNEASQHLFCTMPQDLEQRVFYVDSNEARIVFTTDSSEAGRGFRLAYSENCQRTLTDLHGIVESINYDESRFEPPAINCSWHIRSPRGSRIQLEISHFDQRHELQPTDLVGDVAGGLYLIDGNATVPAKLTVTPIVGLGVHSSSGNSISIVHNSSSVSFRLEYRIVGCLYELHAESGSFESPNYPNMYPNDVECSWLIRAEEGHVIELTVLNVDIQESVNCTKDVLVITNSDIEVHPKSRHCGTIPKLVYTSSGPRLHVHFNTDASHNGRGFEASYRVIKNKCGGKMTSKSGIIESPGYPKAYDANSDCEWIVEVSPHHTIIFLMEDINIESGSECHWDSVTAYDLSASDGNTDDDSLDDSEGQQLFQLCGSTIFASRLVRDQSTTNRALVRFTTDESVQGKGFRLQYRESCGQNLQLDETDFQYISIQRQVPVNESCVWVLRAADPGKHVVFTPTHVALHSQIASQYPNEGDCMTRGVKVYEGLTATGTPRQQFCRSHPPALFSNGAALTVSVPLALISEFEGHVVTVDVVCGSTYSATRGRFTSPYYPQSYPVNIECLWLIEASAGNSLTLTLESFELEQSDGCNNDYLEIREESESGALIGVYCGNTVPPAVVSKGSIWLKFKSNDDVVGEGFMAVYNYERHNELNGTEGIIQSPHYPNKFESDEPYTWRITVDSGYVVLLTADHLRDVDTQYVHFYDGYTDIGPELRPQPDRPIVSHTNMLYMRATRGPFQLSWQRLSKEALAANRTAELQLRQCGEQRVLLDSSRMAFQSPGYPHGYETNLNCTWIVMAKNPAMHVALQLVNMDVEQFSDECYTDYLIVSSSGDLQQWTQLEKLCRPLNETRQLHGQPYLRLQFVTDASVNRTGFSGFLRTVCGSELTAPRGLVNITEMRSQMYFMPLDCVWTLRVRQGKRIRISFPESQLRMADAAAAAAAAGQCGTYLMVRNGYAPDSPFLGHGKYCENNITDVLETSSNRAYIKFQRGTALPLYRAAFRYEEIGHACSGNIRLDESTPERLISSPNYPNLPNPHSECVWRISAPPEHRIALEFLGNFALSAPTATDADADAEESCATEFVQVNDGSTELMPQLGRYCGTRKPDIIYSSGSELRVKFYTGVLEPHAGFQARVKLASCGGSYYSATGVLKSPTPEQLAGGAGAGAGAGARAGTFKECNYTIEVERGSTIELNFESMQLPNDRGVDCQTGTHLQLDEIEPFAPLGGGDGDAQERVSDTLHVCGTEPRRFLVETNKIVVRLRMPRGQLEHGASFQLRYTAIGSRCGETIEASQGVLQTPNYPNGVLVPTHCVWRIQVPKGARVRCEILDFDNGSSVRNGTRTGFYGRLVFANDFKLQSTIGRYSRDVPAQIISTDNRMAIDAFLLPIEQHRGYKLRFSAYGVSACQPQPQPLAADLQYRWSGNDNDTVYCSYELKPPPRQTLLLQVLGYNHSAHWPVYRHVCRLASPLRLLRSEESEQLLPLLLCGDASTTSAAAATAAAQPNRSVRLPFPIEMIVSGGRRNGRGELSLRLSLQPCGGLWPLEPGDNLTITLPQNLSSAANAVDCAWAVGPDQSVEDPLAPQDVQLEVSVSVRFAGSCEQQYLLVYAGPDQNSPRVGRYCEEANELNVVVERGLFVEYHADARVDAAHNSSFQVGVKYGSGCGGHLSYPYRLIDFREQYKNNVECVWDIEAGDGFHIGLTFLGRFYIEDSADCSRDYLRIQQRDTLTGNWTDLQTICGRVAPQHVNTTSSAMRLIFRSNGDVTGDGFTAQLQRNCGGMLYAMEQGQLLSSPDYPRGYGKNLECNYTIVPRDPSSAPGVLASFIKFDLERSPLNVCLYDNVTVTTRDSADRQQQAVLCGVKQRHVYRARESISLVLRTDNTYSGSGFQLMYSTRLCGGSVNGTQMIESPRQHQDDQMPHNSDCYWNLTAPAGKKFTLRFELVDFESGDHYCNYDGVEIFDGAVPDEQRRMARFCGRLTGKLPTLHISGNRGLVHSFSDERDASRGFRALVRVLDNCDERIVLGEQNASYTYSRFVGQYANDLDCGIVFQAPSGYQLTVEFRSFHVQASNSCSADFLEFRDGAGPFADEIGHFCGQDLPPRLASSRHTLFMRFVSDGSGTDTGFELVVRAARQPCGSPLIKLDGTQSLELRSPLDERTGNYARNLECTWKIESENMLHLQFLSLDLEPPNGNGSCAGDSLKIYDTENLQLLNEGYGTNVVMSGHRGAYQDFATEYVYCGRGLPDDYYPNTKQVYVKFHTTDHAANRTGFRLRVVPDRGCRHNYAGIQGRVKFAGTADCDVFITVPSNYTLSLYFSDVTFVLYDCNEESVEVFDRLTNKSLHRMCSYLETGKSIFTQTHDLRLHFKTDSYFSDFDMTYIASPVATGPGCGGDLYNTQGIFTNAFYPQNVRNNSDCRWNIRVPSNTRVLITFDVFDLGSRSTCHTDYLQILELDQEMRRFCGGDKPRIYLSRRSELTVRFKKSVNYDGIGWVIKFQGVDSNFQ